MPALCTHSNLLLSVVCKHVRDRMTKKGGKRERWRVCGKVEAKMLSRNLPN